MSTRSRSAAVTTLLGLLLAAVAAAKPREAPRALTEPIALSSCADCLVGVPEVAGSTGADLLAAWVWRSSFRVFRRVVDANGNLGPEVEVSPGTQADLTGVAAAGEGWFLGFFNPGRIQVQRLDGGANPASPQTTVNNGVVGDAHGSSLAAADGRVLVTFDVNNAGQPTRLMAQLLGDDLMPVGPPVALADASPRTVSRACFRPDGSAVVAWVTLDHPSTGPDDPSLTGVSARVLGPDGAPQGDVLVVAPPTLLTFNDGALACARDGSFAVAWHSNQRPTAKMGWDPVWQWYNAAGNRRGAAQALNAKRKGDQLAPALLVLSNGSLLAVWEGQVGKRAAILGRRFAANGRPRGAEVRLYVAPAGIQGLHPRLTLMPGTGRFALAWLEDGRGWLQVFSE